MNKARFQTNPYHFLTRPSEKEKFVMSDKEVKASLKYLRDHCQYDKTRARIVQAHLTRLLKEKRAEYERTLPHIVTEFIQDDQKDVQYNAQNTHSYDIINERSR